MGSEPDRPSRLGAILDLLPADAQAIVRGLEDEAKTLRITAEALEAQVRALGQLPVRWAANKRFEILKSKFKFPRARTFELLRACSRLYRNQILQVNTRWKARAEIYTMHSFAPFSNLNFFVKNHQFFFAIELVNFH